MSARTSDQHFSITSTMIPDIQSAKPSDIAIRMNIVMFLSLFLSMMSVLVSALIQQWCREFMKYAYPRAPPHKRGRVRTYLYQGLDQFQMKRFMYGVHVSLHISVFLFFSGPSAISCTVSVNPSAPSPATRSSHLWSCTRPSASLL